MRESKVLVALSGGLDSTAATLLLREQGFGPEAVYFDNLGDALQRERVCKLAQNLEVKLHIVDARDAFAGSVINYLREELTAGRTPAPCAFCNTHLKWRLLVETADRLGVTHIATGHYAKISRALGVPLFQKGVDLRKDQTYYLWNVAPEIIERTILPLGGMTKIEVRNYLKNRGFDALAEGGESMSLCFLPPKMAYPEFVKTIVTTVPGDLLDVAGRVVGRHDGYALYTVGQQRRLEIFEEFKEKKYAVVEIRATDNVLIVSEIAEDLYTKKLRVDGYIAHSEEIWGDGINVLVRGLGRNPEGFAKLFREGSALRVELENSAWAVAPGQPVVFYKGDLLLGGGYLATL